MSALDALQYVSPLVIVLGAVISLAMWLKKRFETYLNMRFSEGRIIADTRHTENTTTMAKILTQAEQTNGKVAEHDKAITILSTETRMLTQLFMKEKPE